MALDNGGNPVRQAADKGNTAPEGVAKKQREAGRNSANGLPLPYGGTGGNASKSTQHSPATPQQSDRQARTAIKKLF